MREGDIDSARLDHALAVLRSRCKTPEAGEKGKFLRIDQKACHGVYSALCLVSMPVTSSPESTLETLWSQTEHDPELPANLGQ